MQIDWLTVAAQIVNFLVLVWLLKRFLYQPVIDAMSRREQRISARLEKASAREAQASSRLREYTDKSAALDGERVKLLQEARDEAQEEKRRLLDVARGEIDDQRGNWRSGLEREHRELRRTLGRELAESAVQIARQALADLADAELEDRIVATFLKRLNALPENELASLSESSGPVSVRSSFDLDGTTRERLRQALQPEGEMHFTLDPGIVCGIVMVGGGRTVEWNVSDYLGDLHARVGELIAAEAPP